MAAVYPDSRNPRAFRSLLKEGYAPHIVNEVWIPYSRKLFSMATSKG